MIFLFTLISSIQLFCAEQYELKTYSPQDVLLSNYKKSQCSFSCSDLTAYRKFLCRILIKMSEGHDSHKGKIAFQDLARGCHEQSKTDSLRLSFRNHESITIFRAYGLVLDKNKESIEPSLFEIHPIVKHVILKRSRCGREGYSLQILPQDLLDDYVGSFLQNSSVAILNNGEWHLFTSSFIEKCATFMKHHFNQHDCHVNQHTNADYESCGLLVNKVQTGILADLKECMPHHYSYESHGSASRDNTKSWEKFFHFAYIVPTQLEALKGACTQFHFDLEQFEKKALVELPSHK
jgi:hypothetical protein